MAAVNYYVRRDNQILEICKSIEVVGFRPRWRSDIWLHESRDGSWKAYKENRVNKIPVEQVFAGITKVIGDTYEVRPLLKQLGFRWNPQEKAWVREVAK